jgi:hypothetical protein
MFKYINRLFFRYGGAAVPSTIYEVTSRRSLKISRAAFRGSLAYGLCWRLGNRLAVLCTVQRGESRDKSPGHFDSVLCFSLRRRDWLP